MQVLSALARRLDDAFRHLGSRRVQLGVLGAATALSATSVGPHRGLDDFVLGLIAQGRGGPVGLERSPLDLFTFTTGDVEGNRRLMDVGLMLPWWTDAKLRIAFFRPISSLTHWLDERLFPSSAVLMHLHSLAWFAVFLGAVLSVYRRLESSAVVAGLAFALFAVDDAHGAALSWLANRNAFIAASFGCLTLVAHDAWRRRASVAALALSLTSLVLGLLSGEFAIGVLAYLVAYAVFLDEGERRARLLSLVPYGVVLAAWRALWGRAYGAKGSGAYIDPITDSLSFLAVLPARLAVLLQGQFSVIPADQAFLGPPSHLWFVQAGAALCVVVMGWLLAPVVRADRVARFWATGMLLAAIPLASTFPSDRLLLFVGLGAMALLARLITAWTSGSGAPALGGARAVATLGLVVVHGVGAPLLLPMRAGQMELFGKVHDAATLAIPSDGSVKGRTVVVVVAPVVLFGNYLQAEREYERSGRPDHLYILSDASSPVRITRTGPSRLSIRPEQGFLYTPLERHYRQAPLPTGTEVTLSALRARVTESRAEGRPGTVEFAFERPPGEYLFVIWRDGRYVPFELPAEGESVTAPEEDFGEILLRGALSGTPIAAQPRARLE